MRFQAENFELQSKVNNFNEKDGKILSLETELRQSSETIRTLMGDMQHLQNQVGKFSF